MKKILIGIIGFGNIGKKRLEALDNLSNFAEVKIICEKKKINNKFKKIKIINNVKKLNNYDLDLLIICTPTDISKKIYNKFVGKYHLLIEKPITLNSNELLKNVKKSINRRKILKAGYNLKYDSGLNYVKKVLKSNFIGKIYYCKTSYANGTAKSNSNNVGSIFDMASHSVNLLMWLFNSSALKVISSSNQKNEFSKAHFDNGFATLKIKNILISLHHGFCNWKNIFSLEVYGKNGSLKVQSLPKWGNQTVITEKRVLPSGNPKVKVKKFKNDLSFKNELHSLLETIRNVDNIKHHVIKKINYESYYTLKNSILLK
jgi:predicted dehydrogenase